MGFFNRLIESTKRFIESLGKMISNPGAQHKIREIDLDTITSYVEEQSLAKNDALEKKVFSKLSEVKHLVGEIKRKIEIVRQKDIEQDHGNFTLRRIVRTSQSGLILQIGTLANKLEPPVTNNLHQILEYTYSSLDAISKGVFSARKNIVYTKVILKDEIKELGEIITELNNVLFDLKLVFESSHFAGLQEINKNTVELKKMVSGKKELGLELKEKNTELNNTLAEKEKLVLELDGLKNSPELKELQANQALKSELFQRKRNLRDQFVSLIDEAEKPLHRLSKLASSKSDLLSHEEQEILQLYLQNSVFAVKKDPNAVVLKKLFGETEKLVSNSTIELKDKEKEKKLQSLKELSEYDFFGKIFQKIHSADIEIEALDSKIKNMPLNSHIGRLENEINLIDNKIYEKNSSIRTITARLLAQDEKINAMKDTLEKALLKQTGEIAVIKI